MQARAFTRRVVGKNRSPERSRGQQGKWTCKSRQEKRIPVQLPQACTVPKNMSPLELPPSRSGLKALRVTGLPEWKTFALSEGGYGKALGQETDNLSILNRKGEGREIPGQQSILIQGREGNGLGQTLRNASLGDKWSPSKTNAMLILIKKENSSTFFWFVLVIWLTRALVQTWKERLKSSNVLVWRIKGKLLPKWWSLSSHHCKNKRLIQLCLFLPLPEPVSRILFIRMSLLEVSP